MLQNELYQHHLQLISSQFLEIVEIHFRLKKYNINDMTKR